MKSVVVIPTHITGIELLTNLLRSLHGYSKYPLLVVVQDHKRKNDSKYASVMREFADLPISLKTMRSNSFELGGLYAAYTQTDYDEFFLLSHSCEIVNTDIFDIVFQKHMNASVAFALQPGNWNDFCFHHKKFVLKYLDEDVHQACCRIGDVQFWQGHIGKYRREILNQLDLKYYLPGNMIEAVSKSELLFTSTYHALDDGTVVLFPKWIDGSTVEFKCGKKRLKIMNEYIIKWKTHWTGQMVIDAMNRRSLSGRCKMHFKRVCGKLFLNNDAVVGHPSA